jgi:hypothetical protein
VSLAGGAVAHAAGGGDAGNDRWSGSPMMAHAHVGGAAAQRLFVDSDRGSTSLMAISVVEDNDV